MELYATINTNIRNAEIYKDESQWLVKILENGNVTQEQTFAEESDANGFAYASVK